MAQGPAPRASRAGAPKTFTSGVNGIARAFAVKRIHYMEKGCYVKDISPGSEIQGLFVVSQAAQGQSRNGPYWRLTLADASGSLEAKIWHPLSAEFSDIPAGALVWTEGRAECTAIRPSSPLNSCAC